MLFWGERSNDEHCHTCGSPQWVTNKEGEHTIASKKPTKFLHYFPLIPRLQRLFISKKTSNDMRWHDVGRKKMECVDILQMEKLGKHLMLNSQNFHLTHIMLD